MAINNSKYEICYTPIHKTDKGIALPVRDKEDIQFELGDRAVRCAKRRSEPRFVEDNQLIYEETVVQPFEMNKEDEFHIIADSFVMMGHTTDKTKKKNKHCLIHKRDFVGNPPQTAQKYEDDNNADIEYIERKMIEWLE